MGLTKEVRDFFTERIHRVLDEKLAQITKVIDEKKVSKLALEKFCAKWELPQDIVQQAEKLIAEEERNNKEQQKLREQIEKAINKADKRSNRYNSYYGTRGTIEGLRNTADANFRDEVLAEQYPSIVPQIKHIEHIKGEAASAVLLSTTEAKLVVKLSRLLNQYGGDISELLELLPDLE